MRRNAEPGSSVRSFTVWIELVWLKEGATFSRGAYARLLHACELSVTDLSFDRIERAGPKCLINVTALIAIQCHLQQVYAILS